MTPVEFLTARLDELEDVAKRAAFGWGGGWRTETVEEDWSVVHADGKRAMVGCEDGDVTLHIAANDPAYVLADIAAKRAIIEQFAFADEHADRYRKHVADYNLVRDSQMVRDQLGKVIRALCQPFAEHPDFDSEPSDG